MNDCMRSARISRRQWLIGAGMLLVAGCSVPLPGDFPRVLPALPENLDQVEDLMQQFGLPELSELGDVPELDVLADLATPPGALVL